MQKGQILIWMVVGVLVIAIAGGIYYLGRSNSTKQSATPTVVSQTPQPTPSPTPDETANWKIYTNTNGSVSYKIQYPDDWVIEESPYPCCSGLKNPKDENIHIVIGTGSVFPGSEQDFFDPNNQYWLTIIGNDPKLRISPPTLAMVDNKRAMKQIFRQLGSKSQISIEYTIWFGTEYANSITGKADHDIVTISLEYPESSPNKDMVLKTFDKMLSTFKFL